MIKLQDFARERGVTDRQVHRLLSKYENELVGLFERRGQNGTWLTDEACDILRSKMKQAPMTVTDSKTLREKERLEQKVRELEERLEKKEALLEMAQRRADNLQEKAGQVLALEAGKKAAEKEIKLLEGFINDAKAEIQAVRSEKDKEALRATQAEKNAQDANLKLSEASEEIATLKSDYDQAVETVEKMREEAAQRLREAEERELQAQKEAEVLRQQLEAVRKMTFWQRLFWKGK